MKSSFETVFSIPHLLISCGEKPFCLSSQFENRHSVDSEKTGCFFELSFQGINPAPLIMKNNGDLTAVLGSPVLDDAIDRGKAAVLAKDIESSNPAKARCLDGEFLIVSFDRATATLKIINDRFNAVPLFYYSHPEGKFFIASPYFGDIWDFLKRNNLLKINNEAFFEFLWFQRLFGIKTFALNSYYMPDANILEYHGGKVKLTRYWQRNYRKNHDSLRDNSAKLAELMKKSVSVKAGDGRRYGHFLSGGMDSRSVLAAFGDNCPVCFTVGVSDNREVRTARKIADAKGAEHVFLELDPEHYGMIREPAVKICGGMFNYDHAIFLGFDQIVRRNSDVCFSGYGFDFMFQGMYIPGRNVKIGNHVLYLRKMISLPDDLGEYFIHNASYRIKDANIMNFILGKRRDKLQDFQKYSVSEVLRRGGELSDDRNDLWEYLTFHFITRHYSYPNVLAISSFSESRTVSFTNEIFDLYLSLPTAQRFNGAIEKQTLKMLNPELARIWSANTDLPVTASPRRQTIYQLAKAAKRRITFEKDKEEWRERTWPSREHALRKQATLKKAALDIISSNILEKLDFIDCAKIKTEFPRWLKGEKIHGISGDLVQTIVTIGTFLRNQ